MAPQMEYYVSKTQLYLKVKKPLLERQRRARINKCLDALKGLVAEFRRDDSILRMDKAEMLESVIAFVRTECRGDGRSQTPLSTAEVEEVDGFRNGYINAVNEVSRVMAATPGMNVDIGKAVMTHLGGEYNRLLKGQKQNIERRTVSIPSMSPASSGYCSDYEEAPSTEKRPVWRPW